MTGGELVQGDVVDLFAQSARAAAVPRDTALRELFVAHHRRLVAHARLLVDDVQTAEDVVQDAFASLYRRWDVLRDREAALAYLRVAVANGARSQVRRVVRLRRRRVEHDPDVPSPEHAVVLSEDHRELLAAVRALPRRQREVVVLRYYLDLTEAEIARELAISTGSVKTHASRALTALTTAMEATR